MEIIVLDNPNAEKKMEKEVQKKTENLFPIFLLKISCLFPPPISLITWMLNSTLASYSPTGIFSSMSLTFFSSLVFARAVAPCSKYKTFHDVLPSLFKEMNYSYDQLLDAVEFVGSEYEKLVEIFTVATKENYGTDTSHSF